MAKGVEIFQFESSFLSFLVGVRGLSDHTVSSYSRDLADFRTWLTESGELDSPISRKTVRAYIGTCSRRGYSATSINRRLSALRTFARYLDRSGGADLGPRDKNHQEPEGQSFLDIMLSVRGLRAGRKLPRFLFEGEIVPLLELGDAGQDNAYRDLRDRALFEFMYSTGCRVSEAAVLRLRDIDTVRLRVLLQGKGSRERLAFLGTSAAAVLAEYLAAREVRTGRPEPDDAVFVNLNGKTLSTRGIQYILQMRQSRLGMAKQISPHGIRHSFATHVLGRGADIRVVQELLGHANLRTTQIYTHLDISSLKKTHAQAHPHGSRRKSYNEKGEPRE